MTKPITLQVAIERYLDDLMESEPSRIRTRRSHLRLIEQIVGSTTPARNLLVEYEGIVSQIREQAPARGSHTAITSTLRHLIRWSLSERLTCMEETVSEQLGMPEAGAFAVWSDNPRALSVYKLLLLDMRVGSIHSSELSEAWFLRFLGSLPNWLRAWRSCWAAFRAQWELLEDEGILPEIDLPAPPSRKRPEFAAKPSDLPHRLEEELAAVESRLRGEDLRDRFGLPPYDRSTVKLLIGVLLRLLGHLRDTQGESFESLDSLSDALALDNALSLINRSNDDCFREDDGDTSDKTPPGIGAYEIGQLRQLAAVVRVGLRDEALYAAYSDEIAYRGQKVREGREASKSLRPLDDYFRVAITLIERARALGWDSCPTTATAVFIRDALLFGLIAAFGYRRGVIAQLRIDTNIRSRDGDKTVICIPKENTKPRCRDLMHELPPELEPLLRDYLEKARPLLLGEAAEHAFLFVSSADGSPLSESGIYAQIIARTTEVLGSPSNPHLIRKSLANDYAHWSRGDYMTAAAVLDSSPLTLQRHYARLQAEAHIKNFDEATRHAWGADPPEEGAA